MLLAIDTATHTLSLALHDGNALLAEITYVPTHPHTVELAPAVAEMLAKTGVAQADLTALTATIGPGTYSGLRVGVSFAKGMASALHLPLVGVTTLAVMAAGHPNARGELAAVIAAGRNRITVQRFIWNKRGWQPKTDPENTTWPELLNAVDSATVLCGEVDGAARPLIEAAIEVGKPLALSLGSWRLRRAGWLAELALSRLNEARSQFPDDAEAVFEQFAPARLAPVYVKTKDSPDVGTTAAGESSTAAT